MKIFIESKFNENWSQRLTIFVEKRAAILKREGYKVIILSRKRFFALTPSTLIHKFMTIGKGVSP